MQNTSAKRKATWKKKTGNDDHTSPAYKITKKNSNNRRGRIKEKQRGGPDRKTCRSYDENRETSTGETKRREKDHGAGRRSPVEQMKEKGPGVLQRGRWA